MKTILLRLKDGNDRTVDLSDEHVFGDFAVTPIIDEYDKSKLNWEWFDVTHIPTGKSVVFDCQCFNDVAAKELAHIYSLMPQDVWELAVAANKSARLTTRYTFDMWYLESFPDE